MAIAAYGGRAGRRCRLAVVAACSGPASEGAQVDPGATPGGTTSVTTSPEGSPLPTSINKVANGPQPPQKGVWIGAWVKPEELSQEGRVAAVTDFQTEDRPPAGRRARLPRLGRAVPDRLRHGRTRGRAPSSCCPGRAPTPGPSSPASTTTLIRQQAESLKAARGARSCCAWRWEMDRPNLQQPDLVADRLHRRVEAHPGDLRRRRRPQRRVGSGARWRRASTTAARQPYYPGDDQVDWVCADVYPGPDFKLLHRRRSQFLDWAKAQHAKPIIIGEFGAEELAASTSQQAEWLTALAPTCKTQPQIKALVYFNAGTTSTASPQLHLPTRRAAGGLPRHGARPVLRQRRGPE